MLNTDEKRSFRNISSMAFGEDLEKIDWNEALTLSEKNPNSVFKALLDIVDRIIDKNCPEKRIPKRKRQTKSKPWITGSFKFYKNEKHSLQSIRKASDPIRKRKVNLFKKIS